MKAEGPTREMDIAHETRRSQPATPSLKIQRAVIELLQAEFIEAEGRYRSCWTDGQIAARAQTSIEVVKLIRREAFGELVDDDPEVAKLKKELEGLRKLAGDYKYMIDDEIKTLQHKFDDFIQTKRKQK